jgi:hypothetical protein
MYRKECQLKNEEKNRMGFSDSGCQRFEKKIKRLRESIEVFEQDRDQGKNWPGDGDREAAALKREVAAQS